MFNKNPSRGSRVVPCGRPAGQTDRYDKANSRLKTFKYEVGLTLGVPWIVSTD